MEVVVIVNKNNFVISIIVGTFACILSYVAQIALGTTLGGIIDLLLMLWTVLHLPIHLLLMSIHPPSYLEQMAFFFLVFLQWVLISYLLMFCYGKLQKILRQ
jgi:hypothetical protein